MAIGGEAAELRGALLALFTIAADVPPEVCAGALDAATEACGELHPRAVGAPDEAATRVRTGAARLLNSMCGACRACPRGRGGYMPTALTLRPPSTAE